MEMLPQLAEFNRFAVSLTASEGSDLSIEQIYDRWWAAKHRDEDLAAVQAAVVDFDKGDRGLPAREILAELRRKETTDAK